MRIVKKVRGVLRYILANPSNKGQKCFRLGAAAFWQIYKRTVGLPLIVPLDNGYQFVADPASGNSIGVIYTRLYEPEYIMFLREHIVGTDGAMIDAGAHTGLFTLLLAHLFREGICFEAARDNFELLDRNFRLNDCTRFRALRQAVSDHDGEVDFCVEGSFSGENRVLTSSPDNQGNDAHTTTGRIESVPATTIDSHVAVHPLEANLTFLKIDVEGHEMAALRGARGTLQRAPTAMALVENSDTEAITSFFRELDWRVFAVSKRGEVSDVDASCHDLYNLVACGPEHPLHR
jgi:FkbM family methyltransferase